MKIKKYFRLFLINLVSLWLAVELIDGVTLSGDMRTLASTALVLTLVNLFIKPLLHLLLLPINLITLGAFRWLINVLTLYLVTLIVPQLKVSGFLFPGFSYQGFIIPEIFLTTFWAFVLASFLISLATTFLLWLIK